MPNSRLYENYYCQKGDGFPVFQGSVIQKGYGLGGIISGLTRSIIPLLGRTITPLLKQGAKHAIPIVKEGARELGKHALETGVKSLSDVLTNKKTIRSAVKDQKSAMKRKLSEVMSGSSKKRKLKNTKSQVNTDIFM